MNRECKRCLLYEAGEKVTYKEICDYIATIDQKEKVDNTTYNERLKMCKQCDELISGMCRKCGCYVEIRAMLKTSECPDFDNKKW